MAFRPFVPHTALKSRYGTHTTEMTYGGAGSAAGAAVAIPVILGIVLLPSLVVYPWIVKQFAPEWGYGKRVATGLVFNIALGAIYKIAGVGAKKEEKPAATAPATTTTT